MKYRSGFAAVRHREKMIRKKARRKASVIKERASEKSPPKLWVWQRATPRAA